MIRINGLTYYISIYLFLKFSSYSANPANPANLGPLKCEQLPEQYGAKMNIPKTWVPVHYDLTLQPFLQPTNFTYRGKVGIAVFMIATTNHIFINSVDLHIEHIEIKPTIPLGMPFMPIYKHYCEAEMIGLYFPIPLVQKHIYMLTISFRGTLRSDSDGLVVTDYLDEHNNTAHGVVTDFSPTNARKAFPCFDEPYCKTTFKLNIVHPPNLDAFSTMPAEKSFPLNAAWTETFFPNTPLMPTYMLSIFIGRVPKLEQGRVSIYGEKDFIDAAQFALNFTNLVINKFEKLFLKPFPLPRIMQIALRDYRTEPDENWGLLTYSKEHLAYDPEIHPPSIKVFVANIISHEVAQQVLAPWATPCWWDDLFVSKGCTIFFQFVGFKLLHRGKNMEQCFVGDVLFLMMKKDDTTVSDTAIDHLVENDRSQILNSFNYFAYGKAAAIIRMVAYHIGYANFWRSMQLLFHQKNPHCSSDDQLYDTMYQVSKAYNFSFEKYYYNDWADSEDNFTSIHETKGKNPLSTFVQSWTLTPGYPIVLVYRNYENGSITLHQTHSVVETQGIFNIPITYTRGDEKNFKPETKFIMNTKSHTFEIEGLQSDEWVVLNVQSEGFYRVDYDVPNWQMLIKALWESHEVFPAITRAQMMHDLWRLATEDSGYLKVFLDACRYLSFETDSPAIIVFTDLFRCLYTMTKGSKELTVQLFEFTKLILTKIYETYDWRSFDNIDQCNCFIRTKVVYLMCLVGHEHCRNLAKEHFSKWKNDSSYYKIPVEFKYLIFLYGLNGGTDEDRQLMIKREVDPLYAKDVEAIKLSVKAIEYIKTIFDAKLIPDADIKIHKLYFQSSIHKDIYSNFLIHDVDHREAEASYYESFLPSNKASGAEYEMDMSDYFQKWDKEKDTFFLNIADIRKSLDITPYVDKGYTILNKISE